VNILQIAPQVPYPLLDGGKVGIFNITRHLAERGHLVTLLAFDRESGYDYTGLKRYCELQTVSHSTRNSKLGAALNLMSSIPYNISKYRSLKFEQALSSLLKKRKFDVIHIDHLHMASYAEVCRQYSSAPIILREHNVESVIMDRYAEVMKNPLMRRYLRLQVRRLRRHESAMLKSVDACCAITEIDAEKILALQPESIVSTVPVGIDETYFECSDVNQKSPPSVVFFGALDWIPNQDAVQWFVNSVFPIVARSFPETKVSIIGKNPPPSIRSLQSDAISIKGFIEDLKSEIQRSTVMIAPFRIGSGVRIKILEAFAMRVPVVATTVGCEGIPVLHEQHLLIGDSAEDFAKLILRLLENEELVRPLVEEAYRLASTQYRWDSVAKKLEEVYQNAIWSKLK
jgi:glycosyltransferase involved in cell wall biosynthesis